MAGQWVIEASGPWPITGHPYHVTPQAIEILVRLGWTPPKEEN